MKISVPDDTAQKLFKMKQREKTERMRRAPVKGAEKISEEIVTSFSNLMKTINPLISETQIPSTRNTEKLTGHFLNKADPSQRKEGN